MPKKKSALFFELAVTAEQIAAGSRYRLYHIEHQETVAFVILRFDDPLDSTFIASYDDPETAWAVYHELGRAA